jgi:hypothetical protein
LIGLDRSLLTLGRSLLTLDRSLLTLGRSLLTLARSLLTLDRSLLTLGRSLLTLDRSLLTLDRSLLTLGRSLLTLDKSLLTLDRSLLTLDKSLLTLDKSLLTLDRSLLTGIELPVVARPELELQGSDDGQRWQTLEFAYKPGNVSVPPPWVGVPGLKGTFSGLHQPRLDWQMWFAALGTYHRNPWLLVLVVRILQGGAEARGLMNTAVWPAKWQGPGKAPAFVRIIKYSYDFTRAGSVDASKGKWWSRRREGEYLPPLSLDNPSLQQFMSDNNIRQVSSSSYHMNVSSSSYHMHVSSSSCHMHVSSSSCLNNIRNLVVKPHSSNANGGKEHGRMIGNLKHAAALLRVHDQAVCLPVCLSGSVHACLSLFLSTSNVCLSPVTLFVGADT